MDQYIFYTNKLSVYTGEGNPPKKGFGRLVSLGCGPCSPCTCDLSTSSSLTALYGDLILR